MISFKDKILLITGGTGSFGNAVLRRFLTTDIAEIRILFSHGMRRSRMICGTPIRSCIRSTRRKSSST